MTYTPAEVIIGFNPTVYSEEEGQFISFTVTILEGQTQNDVFVNFDTSDVSATGECALSSHFSFYFTTLLLPSTW